MGRPYFVGVVDVHHADRSFDLVAAKASGVAALWHKATEGVTFKDKRFLDAMVEAKSAGLLRGAYHFASGTSDAVAQADAFLARVGLVRGDCDILLCLDLEGGLDEPTTMTTSEAARFVEYVRDASGRYPVLYAGASKLRERARRWPAETARLARCPLWLAQYGNEPRRERIPSVFAGQGWDLWQYTNGREGPDDQALYPRTVAGFERPQQDRSAFNGTPDELAVWWRTCGRPTCP